MRSSFSWYHCLLAHVCEQQQATSRHARIQTALTGRARFVVAHTTITGSANKLRRMPARLVRAWPDSFVPFLATRRLHARRHAGNTTSRVQTLSTATKRRQKKTTETKPDSGLSRPSENDTSLMLPQTFHCPESGQRSRPGFRLRNQARFESTPATVTNHMGCKAPSQSHKPDTWLNQNTTFANNEIQTNTHTRQQTRTDANRQSNRHSLSIANNDRQPKDLSITQTWTDNIQSDA